MCRQIEELKLEKYKSTSENGTVENSEEERLNALVSSVAHRFVVILFILVLVTSGAEIKL
jgi:hypothetical protein